LDYREDIAGRVLEPGDQWPAASVDSLLVDPLVFLEGNPAGGELVNGLVDVVDDEVED
jgi:hypothetical protein